MRSQFKLARSLVQLTCRHLHHVILEGMQPTWMVLLGVLLQVLQSAKILGAVRTLTSGRKGWIFAAILFMSHPVLLLSELLPTSKLAWHII